MDTDTLLFFFFTLVTVPRRSLSRMLSDTRVCEPQIRARLGTTAHFCEVVVLTLLSRSPDLGAGSVQSRLRSIHDTRARHPANRGGGGALACGILLSFAAALPLAGPPGPRPPFASCPFGPLSAFTPLSGVERPAFKPLSGVVRPVLAGPGTFRPDLAGISPSP